MPKNNTIELVETFIKENEKPISASTQKTYINIGKNIPFNVLTTQTVIIKKLKELFDNPNTLALYLNLIILLRRHNNEETDKLIKFRNGLKDEIISLRKEKLGDLKDKLPTKDELQKKIDEMTGIRYIINYLFINFGLRNKDINLKKVNKATDDKDTNFIVQSKNKVDLIINDFKTDETFGQGTNITKSQK